MFSKYDAHALLDRCFDLTGLGCDTFCDWAPHTNRVYVSIHPGRWSEESKPHIFEVLPRDESGDYDYMMSVPEAIAFMDKKIKELKHGIGD